MVLHRPSFMQRSLKKKPNQNMQKIHSAFMSGSILRYLAQLITGEIRWCFYETQMYEVTKHASVFLELHVLEFLSLSGDTGH